MKILIAPLILIFSLMANAGGSSAGGGGSIIRDEPTMIPVGSLGKLFQQSTSLSITERVREVIEKNKLATQSCPDGSPILTIPEQLQDKIQVLVEPSKSLLEKIFSREEPLKPKAPTIEVICQSEDTYASYNSVALGLVDLANRKDDDGSATYLIAKTFDLGGAIKIVATPRRVTLPAVGGELQEASWYDQTTDTIYFNQLNPCKGFDCLEHRGEDSILVHEIGHSFLKRVYKDQYPEISEWHDIRHLGRQDKDNGTSQFINSQTSQQAAFIEGLANSFEARHYLFSHPFMNRRAHGDILFMTGAGCYLPPVSIYNKIFKQIPFHAPEDNEVYLSSALYTLLSSFKTDEKIVNSGKLQTNDSFIVTTTSTLRQKALIDALAVNKPTNVSELATAFDLQTNSDFGWRMLRQFYFTDYKTGEKLGAQYLARPQTTGFIIGPESHYFVCGGKTEYEKSLSFALRNEKQKINSEALASHAKNVTQEKLINNIRSTTNSAVKTLDYLNQKVLPFDNIATAQTKLAQNPLVCEKDFQVQEKKVLLPLYLKLEKTGHLVPLLDIRAIVQRFCDSKNDKALNISDLNQNLINYVIDMRKSAALSLEQTVVGTKEHMQRVQTWMQTKQALEKTINTISNIVFVMYYAEQLKF